MPPCICMLCPYWTDPALFHRAAFFPFFPVLYGKHSPPFACPLCCRVVVVPRIVLHNSLSSLVSPAGKPPGSLSQVYGSCGHRTICKNPLIYRCVKYNHFMVFLVSPPSFRHPYPPVYTLHGAAFSRFTASADSTQLHPLGKESRAVCSASRQAGNTSSS